MSTTFRHIEMISPLFHSLYIKALCALIDQRVEQQLPHISLRRTLLREIEQVSLLNQQQLKAMKELREDLDAGEDKEPITWLVGMSETGRKYRIELYTNRIMWESDGEETEGQLEYGVMMYQGRAVRTLQGVKEDYNSSYHFKIKSYSTPLLLRHTLSVCRDPEMLDEIFKISQAEYRVHFTKICPDCGLRTAMPTRKEDDFILVGGEYNIKTSEFEVNHDVAQYQCDNCQAIFYKA